MSVAVKHVLDEVLDHVTQITQCFIMNTTHGLRYHVISFILALSTYAGFSLTFEVEGHWLVSRQVPCKTEGRRPEPLGGSGGMLPRKRFRT